MSRIKQAMQAAAGAAGGSPVDIHDVFYTTLWGGTGASQTLTNGIDLAGDGGMVWIKNRSTALNHCFFDTERGANKLIHMPHAAENTSATTHLTAFNSDGFTVGSNNDVNQSGNEIVGWTFKKHKKFFDVITYSGNSTAGRTIAHNLACQPGMILIARRNSAYAWLCWHKDVTGYGIFSSEYGWDSSTNFITSANSSTFTLGSDAGTNGTGNDYVAYLFAHNNGDGIFGPNQDQDIIACGTYVGTGVSSSVTGPTINLGWEPDLVITKNTTAGVASEWNIRDQMRTGKHHDDLLRGLHTYADTDGTGSGLGIRYNGFQITSTFGGQNTSGQTYIYMAIRRGPLAEADDPTKVFSISTRDTVPPVFNTNHEADFSIYRALDVATNTLLMTRFVDGEYWRIQNSTASRLTSTFASFDYNDGWGQSTTSTSNRYAYTWKRYPKLFTAIKYEGNGASSQTINHNLGTTPELIIINNLDANRDFGFYHIGNGASQRSTPTGYPQPELFNLAWGRTNPVTSTGDGVYFWNHTAPTSTAFTVSTGGSIPGNNYNGYGYTAYLFASVAGIQEINYYEGNGSSQTIDCGFSSGVRFLMIKREDAAGSWYIWDSVRGITTGNDPYFTLDSTALEVTTDDSVDPHSSGFIVNQNATTNINVSGGSYVFWAMA